MKLLLTKNKNNYYSSNSNNNLMVAVVAMVMVMMMSNVFSRGVLVRSFTVVSSSGSSSRLGERRRRRTTTTTTTTRDRSKSCCYLSSTSSSSSSTTDATASHGGPSLNTATTTTTTTNPIPFDVCQELLQTAEQAARAAGRIIVDNLGCPPVDNDINDINDDDDDDDREVDGIEQKFNIKDVVTKHDKAAQHVIKTIITQRYPHHTFLGEEDVPSGGQASEDALVNILASVASAKKEKQQQGDNGNNAEDDDDGFIWICDPIDGTANFASGMPLCGVTVTVIYDSQAIIGVIYDPHRDELFYSIRDYGAFLVVEKEKEKRQLRVHSSVALAKDAIVNAGCPADPNAFEASMRGVMALNSQVRGIRIIAASCITLAWIASGRLTAHFGYDLSSWDLVAGALIIQEAGGRITDIDGTDYKITTRNMLCSNGQVQVHDEILQILKDADATTFVRSE